MTPARRFRFLVNPNSGSGQAAASVVPIARLLRDAGAEVDVTYSHGPSDGLARAKESLTEGRVVVAVGGDGMVGSVAGAVVEAGGLLGLIPTGRGNDFARQLGLPSGPAGLAAVLLQAPPRAVDVIDVDGHVVVGSVYAGVDSLASQHVDRARRLPGRIQYPYAALRALASYGPSSYRVEVDGKVHEHDAATVVVANSGYYGSGMHIAPGARVDDGLLDVVLIGAKSRAHLMRSLPKVYDGSHVRHDGVLVWRGRQVRVSAGSDIAAYGDGDPIGPLPRTATVRPGALRVLSA